MVPPGVREEMLQKFSGKDMTPAEANWCLTSILLSEWRGQHQTQLHRRLVKVRRRNQGGRQTQRFVILFGIP